MFWDQPWSTHRCLFRASRELTRRVKNEPSRDWSRLKPAEREERQHRRCSSPPGRQPASPLGWPLSLRSVARSHAAGPSSKPKAPIRLMSFPSATVSAPTRSAREAVAALGLAPHYDKSGCRQKPRSGGERSAYHLKASVTRDVDRHLPPLWIVDGPIEQCHHVRMTRARIIVEPHESLPGSEESQPSPNAPSCWQPSNKEPRKPSLHSVRHLEIRTPRYHRQSRYETVAASVSETVFHPVIPVGNAPARIL